MDYGYTLEFNCQSVDGVFQVEVKAKVRGRRDRDNRSHKEVNRNEEEKERKPADPIPIPITFPYYLHQLVTEANEILHIRQTGQFEDSGGPISHRWVSP